VVGVKTMMEVYNDWDSLFERFCIMTVDGEMSDFSSINYLSDKAPKELIAKLMDFSRKQERLLKCKKRSN
jgi:hypothetical protein